MSRDKIISFHVCTKIGHFWCWKCNQPKRVTPRTWASHSHCTVSFHATHRWVPVGALSSFVCQVLSLPLAQGCQSPPSPCLASLIDFICRKGVYPERFAPAKDCCWEERFASPQWSLYIVQSGLPCIPDVLTVLIPLLNIILMDPP